MVKLEAMKIDILTLFPEMYTGPFAESIVKSAQEKELVEINIHNLRDWGIDERKTVDDRPYGGGIGMVLRVDVIDSALKGIGAEKTKGSRVVLLDAGGEKYTQKKAEEYSKLDKLTIICGHYEGVDARVHENLVDEIISIGDFVLTGGEIPSMVIVDSVVRLIPEVLEREATQKESFSLSTDDDTPNTILEYPQYTRPEEYQGQKVPKVLLSGNHKEIEAWRKEKSLEKTKKVRPDLLK